MGPIWVTLCVAQDVRGRWDSEGDYRPFFNEAEDGYDTQQWIGQQPWSNGRIGMSGGSYLAAVQWLSAPLGSPYLHCLVPRVMCNNYFQELVFPGGAFHLNVAATWGMRTRARTAQSIDFHDWTEAFHTLPLTDLAEKIGDDVPFWKEWLSHPVEDAYWEPLNVTRKFDTIGVPVLEMTGWYDLYQRRAFDNFNGMREHGRTPAARNPRLIVGPWPHLLNQCTCTGEVDFGARSMLELEVIETEWFDYWLKDEANEALESAPLRLFVMGINQWRSEQEWPLARTDWQSWYFHSAGRANTAIGDGTLSRDLPDNETPDHFVYDPRFPVRTIGGANCCSPHLVPWGPYDQRQVEMRSDVLCFTSPPLAEETEITGPDSSRLVRPKRRSRHRLDGQARRRWTDRLRDQPVRLHPPGPLSRELHRPHTDRTGNGLPIHDRRRQHGQRISPGPPDSSRDFLIELPSLRSQPQYRPRDRAGRRTAPGAPNRVPFARLSVADCAAGHPPPIGSPPPTGVIRIATARSSIGAPPHAHSMPIVT